MQEVMQQNKVQSTVCGGHLELDYERVLIQGLLKLKIKLPK